MTEGISGVLLPVVFHRDTPYLAILDGDPYVPMKRLMEGIGLNWKTQLRKLSSDSERWGMVILTMPSARGAQENSCLPLRKVFGWLMTLSPNKVRPDIRERIIAYQRECDDVLWRQWMARSARGPEPLQAAGELHDREFLAFLHLTRGRFQVSSTGTVHDVVSINTAKVLQWLWHHAPAGAWWTLNYSRIGRVVPLVRSCAARALQSLASWGVVQVQGRRCRLNRQVFEDELNALPPWSLAALPETIR